MADTDTQAQETVSKEAFDRRVAELDAEKAKTASLEDQLAAARKMNGVESFLRDQGIPKEEIPGRMELLAPHLPEIPHDGISEALNTDKFKPLVAPPTAPTPTPGDGEETTPPSPFPPDGGFGAQPSPGGEGVPIETGGKIGPGDQEYEAARLSAQRGDHSKMQKLYDDDRVQEPQSPWF